MKQLIALIATAVAVTAFAAEPAKKEEKNNANLLENLHLKPLPI